MKNFTERPISILPVFILLISAFLSTSLAYAQEEEREVKVVTKMVISEDDANEEVQIIKVSEINGETTVKVTTKTDGETITVEYTGEEAHKFLENEHHSWNESAIGMEDMKFTFDVSGMEKGDCKKIIVMTDIDSEKVHEMKWQDFDVKVADNASDDQIKIEIKYSNENGKMVIKTIVVDPEHIASTLEDLEELLEDLDLHLDIEFDTESDKKQVIIQKYIYTDEMDTENFHKSNPSSTFESITISPNPAEDKVQITITPKSKGVVRVTVTDLQGSILYHDKYNGKGTYSKTIHLQEKGTLIIRLEQGNEVEVRKVILH